VIYCLFGIGTYFLGHPVYEMKNAQYARRDNEIIDLSYVGLRGCSCCFADIMEI